MPKYIDADALRKRMEQIAEESKPAATARPMREDTPSELLRYGTARAMIEWLDDIPAADVEPKQRWIPVTERLPEEPGEYIVAYHPCHWDIVGPSVKVGIDTFRGKTTWAKNKYQRVIAWQDKPEPPKEGEYAERH